MQHKTHNLMEEKEKKTQDMWWHKSPEKKERVSNDI
jgi:hypothetical protein